MMGNPHEASGGQHMAGGSGGASNGGAGQKATFSGMTVLIGIIALILDIISVAVPQWGDYYPRALQRHVSAGKTFLPPSVRRQVKGQ